MNNCLSDSEVSVRLTRDEAISLATTLLQTVGATQKQVRAGREAAKAVDLPLAPDRWACICCREVQIVAADSLPGRKGHFCACMRGVCGRLVTVHGGRWLAELYDQNGLDRYGVTEDFAKWLFQPTV